MYRIALFKKKIRSVIPGGENIRFQTSRDRWWIIIPIDYYPREKTIEVGMFVAEYLKVSGIEFKVNRNMFGLYSHLPESEQPIWSIGIPVDQAALPERKRINP